MQGKEGAERRDSGERKESIEPQMWIKWFGENNLSQVLLSAMCWGGESTCNSAIISGCRPALQKKLFCTLRG